MWIVRPMSCMGSNIVLNTLTREGAVPALRPIAHYLDGAHLDLGRAPYVLYGVKLIDVRRAPYVLYGVKLIDLIDLVSPAPFYRFSKMAN